VRPNKVMSLLACADAATASGNVSVQQSVQTPNEADEGTLEELNVEPEGPRWIRRERIPKKIVAPVDDSDKSENEESPPAAASSANASLQQVQLPKEAQEDPEVPGGAGDPNCISLGNGFTLEFECK